MTAPVSDDVRKALAAKDPHALAASASKEQLDTLRSAEDLIEADRKRLQSTNRFSVAAQVLVGWVAILGFLVNAYQSWTNKQQAERQAEVDQDRWSKEFQRAREADKYRAFFETTVLATDAANPDKRLVGYALLQEFVSDNEYTDKAMLMLEESLSQELRSNTGQGIDDAHRNAVVAIVTALSETRDCGALARAARSIDRVAQRHGKYGDVEETTEVFGVYVRRLVGQAAKVCKTMADFRAVRRPLRDTLVKAPLIGGLKFPTTPEAANTRIAEILRDRCLADMAVSGATDCPDIFAGYAALCDQPEVPPKELTAATPPKGKGDAGTAQEARADAARDMAATKAQLEANRQADSGGCAIMKEVSPRYPPPAAGVSGSSK
ncbi:MAG TPA: hypothetical protein VMT11_13040 [Myxococcaceae bacterium]|nr:hypothetical protein [Myxococcaceae bacterium]